MYTINVRAIPHTLPRMCAVDFEVHPGGRRVTVIVSATGPEAALERAFQLCPEYLHDGRQGHVREIECAVIDWERDRASVVERKMRNRKPRRMADAGRVKEAPR